MNVPTSSKVDDTCYEHIFQGLNCTLALIISLWMVKGGNLLEFSVGDHVLLKVSPWKGVVCFGKKGKLAP
ncbi:hypothetical protein Tco_1373182, partial [Tanacetum coccineum]